MEVNEFILLVINNASQMNLYEKMLHVDICDIRNYYGVFFCLHGRNHEWFRKDLPVYLFPSSTLESDIVDQEGLAIVCEVSV